MRGKGNESVCGVLSDDTTGRVVKAAGSTNAEDVDDEGSAQPTATRHKEPVPGYGRVHIKVLVKLTKAAEQPVNIWMGGDH